MNCREFRRKHDAYIDDTLSGVDIEAMGRHLRLCAHCAALDTRIRRSLLLAHNLPSIQPSAAFTERLQMRLTHERALKARQHATAGLMMGMMTRHRSPFSTGTYVALATGIAVAAGLTMSVILADDADPTIRLAPVVASAPEPEPVATRHSGDGRLDARGDADLGRRLRRAARALASGERRHRSLTP